jgi:hypothetical protein
MGEEDHPDSEGQEIAKSDDNAAEFVRQKEGNGETDQPPNRYEHVRENVGALLSNALWFFIDIKYVKEDSYQWALWLGIFWLVFQCIEGKWFVKKFRTACAVSGSLILGGIVLSALMPPTPPHETESHFWLVPANDPDPSGNPCAGFIGSAVPRDAIFLHIGPLVYWIAADEIVRSHVLIAIRHVPLLLFNRQGSKVSISGDVLDSAGFLVADIERNEVHLVQGEYAFPKRPDGSTIEVIGRKREELLYLRFANPTTIRLRGTFPIPNSPAGTPPVVITDSAIENGGIAFGSTCTHSNPKTGTINFGD